MEQPGKLMMRSVRESDLPELRDLILPGFYPLRRKVLMSIAKNWMVQAFLAALSALAFTFENGGIFLWLLVYISLNAITLFVSALICNHRISKGCNDLWNWEVCLKSYSEGFWVAEIDFDGNLQIVGSYALTKPAQKSLIDLSSYGLAVELKRMAVSPHMRRKGIGKKLVEHASDKAKSLGHEIMMLYTSETSEPAIVLYSKTGFKTEKVLSGFVKVHFMVKSL